MAGRVQRIDRKIKRLAAVEASYRKELRAAEEAYRAGRLPAARYRRVRARCERRIEKLLDRIRALREKRAGVQRP